MSARVKHFLSALLHALKEERHFALIDGVAFPNRRLARTCSSALSRGLYYRLVDSPSALRFSCNAFASLIRSLWYSQ